MALKHTNLQMLDKFLRHIKNASNGCWLWTGFVEKFGYGRFYVIDGKKLAHRFSWELFNETCIPKGLVIDHICRNPLCVNPQHLRVVTQAFNCSVGDGPTATNQRKTHCVNGHHFNTKNTRIVTLKNGSKRRTCLICTSASKGEITGLNWRGKLEFCKRGHPFNEANTRYGKQYNKTSPHRVCRICEQLRMRQRHKV